MQIILLSVYLELGNTAAVLHMIVLVRLCATGIIKAKTLSISKS